MSKNNEYSTSTQKYISAVKKFLKEKYGKVAPEWEQSLILLADNIQMYQDCKEEIKQTGLMVVAKNGCYTKSPLLKVLIDCQVQITKLVQEFGLSPRSQAKINLVDDDNDELKELLGD